MNDAGETPTHWFQPVAAHLGEAYWAPDTGRVMAFTKGTAQEVEFLWRALGLEAGQRVLDVGCGPGRHALALGRRGAHVTGIDISDDFIELARRAATDEGLETCTFEVGDAADLGFDGHFDAVISLCQGGFGLPRDEADDFAVFANLVRAGRPGGALAVSAFSAYFQVRFLEDHDAFDADRGVNHEEATVRGPEGSERSFDLWTSCWTPRELRLLAERHRLADVRVHGVAPGRYEAASPDLDCAEFLLLARIPGPTTG